MNGNLVLGATCVSLALIPLAITILGHCGIEPDWLVAIAQDRVALACGTAVIIVGLGIAARDRSPIVLACVALGAFVVHAVIAHIRLRTRRRRSERALDA